MRERRLRRHAKAQLRRPSALRRRLARRCGDRGAVMVEAAFVLPILILVTFGIIEYGMAYGTASTTSQASRTGARLLATTLAPAGTGNYTTQATSIAAAVRVNLLGLSNAVPVEMMIYKADTTTGKPVGQSSFVCSSNCWDFTWNTTTKAWNTPTGTGWTPAACGTNIDTAGVWVKVRKDFITKLFGSSLSIAKYTVVRLEPLAANLCS